MTELRRRVERLEHLATNAASVSADANDLANFPGNKNLVAGSGITLTPDTGTLTIAASGGGLIGNRIIRKDFHGVMASDELYAYVSSPMVIDGVSILANTSGDLVVDVRKVPIGGFPATGGDSICASAKPTLTADQTYLDTTLTGWDKAAIIGDTYTFHIDSVTTVTDFEITLFGQSAYGDLTVTGAFSDTPEGSPLVGTPLLITGGDGVYGLDGSPYSGTRPAGVTISVSGSDLVASGNTTTIATYSWTERVTSGDGQHYDVVCSMDVTEASDPYFSDVVVLLNAAGADASTSIIDVTGRTWTPNADIQIDTSLGYNAILFDAFRDWATTPYVKSDFDWWTGDFTIEAWVRLSSYSDWSYSGGDTPQFKPTMLGCANTNSLTNYWSFGPINTGALKFYYYNGSEQAVTTSAAVSLNTLTHIAMCKTSSGIYLSIGGTVETPVAVVGTPRSSATSPVKLEIGQINYACIHGWIKALRITKGVARYTSNFTPPTAPFPES